MSTTNESILIGLSGGVDSAVSALLLKAEGYTVTGAFMKNWDEDDGTEYCTAIADYEDAQRIAAQIDIPLLDVNFSPEYWDRVFAVFLREYRAGRTPNPDVLCNSEIKFGLFLDYASSIGASRIATGHYAGRSDVDGDFALLRAADSQKDQTYFLQAVTRDRLSQCLFPLSQLTKDEVRAIARKQGFHVYDKKDSTGICFIGERRFKDFLNRYIDRQPGLIVDTDENEIGSHDGLAFFTLGQRQGLGIGGRRDSAQSPWYVLEKRESRNELVVTQDEGELMNATLIASEPNWLVDDPSRYGRCEAAVRYRQRAKACSLFLEGDRVKVEFDSPQRAITPGQYVAFYDQNRCLGGALIEEVVA